MKLLITGYIILLAAVFVNIIADYLNIFTWYKFINSIVENGLKIATSSMNVWDFMWLFILYPIILSLSYLLGEKIYNLMI